VKVKIEGANLVAAVVSAPFEVKGNITLNSPSIPGIEYTLGDTPNVTWSVSGDIGNVKVEYFDGSVWSTITTLAPQAGPFALSLNAPNTTVATDAAKVRISDADDPNVTDTSINAFLVQPYIAVTSPAGGEAWVVEATESVDWNLIGSNVGNVRIDYSTDSGTSYPNIVTTTTANDGQFDWVIPDNIQSVKNMKVKISTLPTIDPWAISAVSNGQFQIVGALEMAQPDDTTGVKWRVETTGNIIQWNSTGSIATVRLEYSTDGPSGPWSLITAAAPSGDGDGKSFSWDIPTDVMLTKGNFSVRVADSANTDVKDVSEAASSILANFNFTAPVFGNIWVAENTHTIEWTTPEPGVPANVKLEYDLNDGSGWRAIDENFQTANDGIVANSGSQIWTLGTGLSAAARVRISDPNDTDTYIQSNAFKVRGDLTLTVPNSGLEQWEIETYHAVTWSKKGDITAVRLEFSNNGDDLAAYEPLIDDDGKNTQNIDVTGAGPFSFNWKVSDVPGITTTTARVRVIDASDPTVYDAANADFMVLGRVLLAAPNGGEVYKVGDPINVSGSVFGPINNVKLFYSTNGVTYDFAMEGCEAIGVVNRQFNCNWSIPDKIGTSISVKIEDGSNPLVFDTSDAVFSIKGSATITNPTSASVWTASDAFDIIWDRTGSIGNVDLFYSVDSGVFQTIATQIGSPLQTGNAFNWTLPSDNIVSLDVKVRVEGENIIAPYVTEGFTVKGKIALNFPSTEGIEFTLGESPTLTWTTAGDIGGVKVEYFDGSGWSTITTNAPQNGPYVLFLDEPNTTKATASAKVRVSDADDASVIDQSDYPFLVKPYISITSPAGSEALLVGNTHNVTWDTIGSNVGTVSIFYSKDGGQTYSDVVKNPTANDGVYEWTVPDDIQPVNNMKIRVQSLPQSDPWAVTAISNGLFKIVGQLTMVSPVSTDRWEVNSVNNIRWQRIGSIVTVRMDYTTNDGGVWNTITTNTAGNSGDVGFAWTIPNAANIVSTNVKIRIADILDTSVYDESDVFTVVPKYTLTSPVAGDKWIANRMHTITWTREGLNPTANLYYSKDNFSGAGIPIALETDNDGAFDWMVPDPAELADGKVDVKVRITYPDDETAFDDSESFNIIAGFTIVAPNEVGNNVWDVGSAQTFRWTSTSVNVPKVKIKYSTDGGVTYPYTLVTDADNTGAVDAERTWDWEEVDDTISAQVRAMVADAKDENGAFDFSDKNGKIKAFFELVTPDDGNLVLKVDDVYNVTWNWTGTVPEVFLEYSRDSFNSHIVMMNAGVPITNDGSYEWTIPDAISVDSVYRVRVRSSTDSDGNDMSNNSFKIKANIEINRPNGGEKYKIGLDDTIEWTTHGTVPNVKIVAYSTQTGDPGFPYTLGSPLVIQNTTSNVSNGDSVYNWINIPNLPSPNVKLRIIDLGDQAVYYDSAGTFRIQGQFTLAAPNGGEVWAVTDLENITWSWGGNIPQAFVEFTYDNGATWYPIQETWGIANDGVIENDGSYAWTVPDNVSAQVKVRISDPLDATVSDESEGVFKIRGAFFVDSPNGGERWVAFEDREIQWHWNGSLSHALVEYSVDGGASFNPVREEEGAFDNDGIVVNDGTFSWHVPDELTSNALIRISDPNDTADAFDVSDNEFLIDYYYITWDIRALLTNAYLDQLSIDSTDGWFESGIISPRTQGHPFGPWVALWTRKEYGDQTVNFIADKDQTIQVFMETQVVHVWIAQTDITYNSTEDSASIASVLVRDGAVVPGVVFNRIEIYDGDTLIKDFQVNGQPNARGFYVYDWAATGLQSGITYQVVSTMEIATGGSFKTPMTFNVIKEKQLENINQTVTNTLDQGISTVTDSVNSGFATQQTVILSGFEGVNTKIDTAETNIGTAITSSETNVVTAVGASETRVRADIAGIGTSLISMETSIKDKIDTNQTALITQIDTQTTTIGTKIETERSGLQSWLGGEMTQQTADVVSGVEVAIEAQLTGVEETVRTVVQTEMTAQQAFLETALEEQEFILTTKLSAQETLLTTGLATQETLLTTKLDAQSSLLTSEFAAQSSLLTAGLTEQKDIITSEFASQITLMQTEFAGQITVIDTKFDEQSTLIEEQMDEQLTLIQTETDAMREATQEVIAAGEDLEEVAVEIEKTEKKFAGRVLVPDVAILGEPLRIRFRGPENNLAPVVDILDHENNVVFVAQPMKAVPNREGLYEYIIQNINQNQFTPGQAMSVIVSEPVTGNISADSIFVESASLTTLSGLIAAQSGNKGKQELTEIQSLLLGITSMLGEEGDMNKSLDVLKDEIERLPDSIAEQEDLLETRMKIENITSMLATLSGGQGDIDLSMLIQMGIEEGIEESTSIRSLRSQAFSIEETVDEVQKTLEEELNEEDEPVVHVIYS